MNFFYLFFSSSLINLDRESYVRFMEDLFNCLKLHSLRYVKLDIDNLFEWMDIRARNVFN